MSERHSAHSECWFGEPCAAGMPDTCHVVIADRAPERGEGWGALSVRREHGGLRHYLEGEPVHCGAGLVLQAVESRHDDYGTWNYALPRGTRVRYEAQISREVMRATLHADVGGHEFLAPVEPWMRFRWPERD